MKVYYGIDQFKNVNKPVLTTGTFDGVHLGHRKILEQLNRVAQEVGGESVLFTFFPHPRMVIFPDDHGLELLNTQQEKIAQLQEAGLQHLIIEPFTKEFSRLTALEYVRDILVGKIGVDELVIGYDHQFGKNREGNFNQLVEFGQMFGFGVKEIPAQDINDVNVSSTKIRQALAEGDVAKAKEYLTYPFSLSGSVIHGDGIGKQLDFPTANIEMLEHYKLIPKNGVYIVQGRIGKSDKTINGMMNIGYRPTINHHQRLSLEVHFFDWKTDIYGEYIQIEFIERIRDEQKFEGIEALQQQLQRDKNYALEYLRMHPSN